MNTGISLTMQNGEPMADSLLVAAKFEKRHKDVLRAIEGIKNQCRADFWRRNFAPRDYTDERGKTQPLVEMTRDGFAILAMGFTGSRATLWKIDFIDAFNRMERHILKEARKVRRQAKIEWQAARVDGKLTRRQETDTVKRFVVYAGSQGSKNADKYYMVITKMQNAALFLIGHGGKPGNLREAMTVTQLSITGTADNLVDRSLDEGMDMGLFYKDVYKLAKQKIEQLATVLGKSQVPSLADGSVKSV